MSTWPKDELRRIAESDHLHVAPLREDGVSCGTPTWVWSLAVDDAYRAKYRASPCLAPMVGAGTRAATVKIVPRETDG
jgi:hypothetical protein